MKCTLDLAPSGALLLEIPSVLAEGRSHFVEIPFTLAGLSLIKKTLLARQASTQTIGMRGSPTAQQVHQFLEQRQREEHKALLIDIVLDL